MRILVVEDDTVLADSLIRTLRQSSHAVDWIRDGVEADRVLNKPVYDLVILDLGLPRMDGFEVLRRLRLRENPFPVLILSARDAVEDRVKGLDLGADDFLGKPFQLSELEARVRAMLRRGLGNAQPKITIGDLEYDTLGRRVTINGKVTELSARELTVLEVLMMRAGKIVSKEQLVEHLYDWGEEISTNAIEVYIHRIRKAIEPSRASIQTIRGLGYLLEKGA
jgi:DNA-binding response OmpR family regulator